MRTYLKIISYILITLTITSCQKFIDIKKSSNQFFMSTANDCQLLLDNYAKMNTGYPIDAEISADDYFLTGTSFNLASIPQEEKNLYIWNPEAQRISGVANWQNAYQVVYNANLVLETLDKLKGNDDPVLLNTLRGSALFYRAYCFWNIAQMYASPYSPATAGQDPGIPLRLDSDINGKSSRGTVQDVYNRILQDLKEALTLLPTTSSVPTRPNKVAAYAMLARTYLSMSDYANALINSDAALDINSNLMDYNNINQNSATPFIRFNTEVIFHTISQFRGFAPIAGPILNPGSTFVGSNVARINTELAASYSANDLRSKIFLKKNNMNIVLEGQPLTVPDGTYRFTGNYEPAFSPTFFTGLAVDEMLLTRAECYARTGNVALAAADLNSLLIKRWQTGTYTNMNPDTPADIALATILSERRKELLMRGLRWTDLRRLKLDAIRQTKNITFSGTKDNPIRTETIVMTNNLPANDPRYSLLIPKEIMDNTEMAQNVR